MSDQPVDDGGTAGRLRQLREQVRAETPAPLPEAMCQQQENGCLNGGRDLQLYSQVQPHLAEVIARQQVREQPFRSTVPLFGPLIAWFRGLWNRVSTTWYVRPLLEQQVAYNAAVANVLQDLHHYVEDLDHYVQTSSHDLVRRTDALFQIAQQEAAVLAARCDDLRADLDAVQESLERLQAARPGSAADV